MKAWSKAAIVELLNSNDRAVERGLVAIYQRQTLEEQVSSTTVKRNGIGFSGSHARLGTYYAKWILGNRRLTGQHLSKGRAMILHYAGQLLEIANSKT